MKTYRKATHQPPTSLRRPADTQRGQEPAPCQIDPRCRLGNVSQVGDVLRGTARDSCPGGRAALDLPGLLSLWDTGEEVPLPTNAHLSDVWVGAGPRRECRPKHPLESTGRYPGAQGNL